MKKIKYILFCTLLSSCLGDRNVIGEINDVRYVSTLGGATLCYVIKYEHDGKKDSTILLGRGIFKKGTYEPFYFEKGDSIVFKLSPILDLYQLNSFVRIHRLVKKNPPKAAALSFKEIFPERYVDTLPLLPKAKKYKDNNKIINASYKKLNIPYTEPIVFSIIVDPFGKAQISSIYSEDSLIVAGIEKIVRELPLFTPAIREGEKVNVWLKFEISQ